MSDEIHDAMMMVEASLIPGSPLTAEANAAAWTLAKAFIARFDHREEEKHELVELRAEIAELTERIRAYLAPLEMPPLNCKRQVRDECH